jgi:hypothetical protein
MTSVGNPILIVHSKLRDTSIGCVGRIILTKFSSLKSFIRSIAETIRGQITRTREPENLRRLIGLSNEIINRATESGHLFWLFPYQGAVGINNTFKTLVHNQHFGYPGRTRFCKFLYFYQLSFMLMISSPTRYIIIHGSACVPMFFEGPPYI